jgi:hypothetical protein
MDSMTVIPSLSAGHTVTWPSADAYAARRVRHGSPA